MANPISSDANPAVMALAYDGEWFSLADFFFTVVNDSVVFVC